MRFARLILPAAAVLMAILIPGTAEAKKKNPDDFTQTLAVAKEPPAVTVGETRRLVFNVSPLSGKGLLSQQTRDALKAILKENGGVPVIHLRAFVAGSGDIRRIPQIVSEVFTERKLPLPSVSVVLCGGLPMTGAQVVIESVSSAKRDVNSGGLSFIAGTEMTVNDPNAPVGPLLEKSVAELAGKMPAGGAIQVSCFVSNVENASELMRAVAGRFPAAAIDVVQTQRAPYRGFSYCEGVAHGGNAAVERLAFTGSRVAFGAQDQDAALAFQRLDRDLTGVGATRESVLLTHVYAVQRGSVTPGAVVIPFEGVASHEGSFAVDAVAAVSR